MYLCANAVLCIFNNATIMKWWPTQKSVILMPATLAKKVESEKEKKIHAIKIEFDNQRSIYKYFFLLFLLRISPFLVTPLCDVVLHTYSESTKKSKVKSFLSTDSIYSHVLCCLLYVRFIASTHRVEHYKRKEFKFNWIILLSLQQFTLQTSKLKHEIDATASVRLCNTKSEIN